MRRYLLLESNAYVSHMRSGWDLNSDLRGGRCATTVRQ